MRRQWFEQSFDCDGDGHGRVQLPDGLPLLLRVEGEFDAGEGDTIEWSYDVIPRFHPEGELVLPCDGIQDGGRVVYVFE